MAGTPSTEQGLGPNEASSAASQSQVWAEIPPQLVIPSVNDPGSQETYYISCEQATRARWKLLYVPALGSKCWQVDKERHTAASAAWPKQNAIGCLNFVESRCLFVLNKTQNNAMPLQTSIVLLVPSTSYTTSTIEPNDIIVLLRIFQETNEHQNLMKPRLPEQLLQPKPSTQPPACSTCNKAMGA